jgi:hypothetical protein
MTVRHCLFFMDESYGAPIAGLGNSPIASLTGMLVDIDRYRELRSEYYSALRSLLGKDASVLDLPFVHGSKLLPDETDDVKLCVVRMICELVERHHIQVYRSGYIFDAPFRKSGMPPIGVCFLNLLTFISPVTVGAFVWPVMELGRRRDVQMFSNTIRFMDLAREAGHANAITLPRSENIGEVLYATKNHSVLSSIVDLVSYIRHVTDLAQNGAKISKFKKELLAASLPLASAMIRDEVTRMKLSGPARG